MELKKQAMDWIEHNKGMNSTALIRDMLTTIEQLEQFNATANNNLDELREWNATCLKNNAELESRKNELESAIIKTLNENGHLADGDVCTLIDLKRAMPRWELEDES